MKVQPYRAFVEFRIMVNVVIVLVIVAIVGAAVAYIVREKKRGVKCIGCPYAQQCANRGKCGSGESCSGNCAESPKHGEEA